MPGSWRERTDLPGWVLLPLRAFLGVVFVDAGISKIADRRFLDAASSASMHASVEAIRATSPLGGLLGPVADHSWGFGILIAVAELAVGLGVLAGLFTRIAALGGMLLALSLWLTISWGATPWFTSADLAYLFAFTPLLAAGAGGVLSADAWLASAEQRHPGTGEDPLRRSLLAGGLAVLGAAALGVAASVRRTPVGRTPVSAAQGNVDPAAASRLTSVASVPVGGAQQVRDPQTGDPAWVLQLQAGQVTAFDAVCPHQGCTVEFVSAADGFACPCHGSRFDAQGKVVNGPASRDLTSIAVTVQDGTVRTA